MSKTVFGECRLCPKGTPERRIYGDGVCAYHLGHPEDDQSKKKEKKEEDKKKSEKKILDDFFREQSKLVPAHCENCGERIVTTAAWPKKAAVCHIVEKRHFKSVLAHPMNRWFGCIKCHTNYDTKGWSYAITMPIFKKCIERFKHFMDSIKDTELKFLPDKLRELTGR